MKYEKESYEKQLKNVELNRINEVRKQNAQWQKAILYVLDDIDKMMTDQIHAVEDTLPTQKVANLLNLIKLRLNSRAIDMAISRAGDILREIALPGGKSSLTPKPKPKGDTLSDFESMDWHQRFDSLLKQLTGIRDFSASHKVSECLDRIGWEIVPIVVESVDYTKKQRERPDPELEKSLEELMDITGVWEMDVEPGYQFDPDKHELDSDRENIKIGTNQVIARVISRGLVFKGGKTVKAKVTI